MKRQTTNPNRRCRKCGRAENQVNAGLNRSGTQRCFCKDCKKYYTLGAKTRENSDEIKTQALKIYYSGVSARGVGKVMGMSAVNPDKS